VPCAKRTASPLTPALPIEGEGGAQRLLVGEGHVLSRDGIRSWLERFASRTDFSAWINPSPAARRIRRVTVAALLVRVL